MIAHRTFCKNQKKNTQTDLHNRPQNFVGTMTYSKMFTSTSCDCPLNSIGTRRKWNKLTFTAMVHVISTNTSAAIRNNCSMAWDLNNTIASIVSSQFSLHSSCAKSPQKCIRRVDEVRLMWYPISAKPSHETRSIPVFLALYLLICQAWSTIRNLCKIMLNIWFWPNACLWFESPS